MIARRRLRDGRNLDVNLGPGPVGTTSQSGYMRAMGAVPLTQAIAPKLTDVTAAYDLARNRLGSRRKK